MLHAPPIHHSIDGAAACKAPARALQKVARVVVEKESTGRHVLLRVSSDHGGRSDHQSEPSEGPYTARTCTQGQKRIGPGRAPVSMQDRASTLGNRAIKKRCVTPPVCAGGLTPRPARNHLGPTGAPGRKRFGHIGSIAGARGGTRFGRFMSEQACRSPPGHAPRRAGASRVPSAIGTSVYSSAPLATAHSRVGAPLVLASAASRPGATYPSSA